MTPDPVSNRWCYVLHRPFRRWMADARLQPDEPFGDGVLRQRNGGVELQLVHHAEHMEIDGLDGLGSNVEQRGHLFRPSLLRNQLQHFSLTPSGEGCH